jgi:hypothetical protein
MERVHSGLEILRTWRIMKVLVATLVCIRSGDREYAGGPRAAGVAAATLAQLCLLFPVVVVATGIITHKREMCCFA